jgi:hypothetical protein
MEGNHVELGSGPVDDGSDDFGSIYLECFDRRYNGTPPMVGCILVGSINPCHEFQHGMSVKTAWIRRRNEPKSIVARILAAGGDKIMKRVARTGTCPNAKI